MRCWDLENRRASLTLEGGRTATLRPVGGKSVEAAEFCLLVYLTDGDVRHQVECQETSRRRQG